MEQRTPTKSQSHVVSASQDYNERQKRADEAADRLYHSPTINFLYKTVQRSSSSYRSRRLLTSPQRSRELDAGLYRSLTGRLDIPTRESYGELMKSFKSEPVPASGPEDSHAPVMPPLAFLDSIRGHDRKLRESEHNVFRNEARVKAEILKDIAQRKRQLVPTSFAQSVVVGSIAASPLAHSPSKGSSPGKRSVFWDTARQKDRFGKRLLEVESKPEIAKSHNKGLVERCMVWQQDRNDRVARQQMVRRHGELAECTFTPSRVTKSSRLAEPYESSVEYKTSVILKASQRK